MRVRAAIVAMVCGMATLGVVPWTPAPAGAAPVVPTTTQVVTAYDSTCALSSAGGVKCWGGGGLGQIGDGAGENRLAPTGVAGLSSGVSALAAGDYHVCALLVNGSVRCWGQGTSGQGGDGTLTNHLTPVTVVGLGASATAITGGGQHTCALLSGGTVTCWGRNEYGQLGDGTTTDRPAPVAVSAVGTAFAQVSAGSEFTCARTTSGAARCWGRNPYGQLGDGTQTNRSTPTAVSGLASGVTTISAGGSNACAIVTGGALRCWGANGEGQVGDGTRTGLQAEPDRLQPVAVSGLGSGVVDVTLGSSLPESRVSVCTGSGCPPTPITYQTAASSTCALTTSGAVSCWGYNRQGQLGDGTTTERFTPEPVSGLTSGRSSLSEGLGFHACALTAAGATSCWGFNSEGQVGSGSAGTDALVPASVPLTWSAVDVPGAPTIGSATFGDGQATVSWTAPVANGGATITGYVVTPFIGANAQAPTTFDATATTRTITGLANGTTYTFKVAAKNLAGTGPQSAASATVKPGPGYAPFASWGAFVDRQHVDITTKLPSSAQRSSWVSQLASGAKTKGDLVDALRRGPENLANVDPVVRVYRAFLGRAPDAGGLQFWIKRKRNVAPAKTWTVTQIATEFTSSNEFKTKYGSLTNRQFVTQIYTDVLGRPADPSGVNYWTGKLDRKEKTKAQVVVGFSESNEYKNKQAQNTDVAVAYIYLLGQAPNTSEANDWVTRQKAGTTHSTLLGELLGSSKYVTHVTG